jgi:hemolysin-activating ACP:hemolysin acyltransferase
MFFSKKPPSSSRTAQATVPENAASTSEPGPLQSAPADGRHSAKNLAGAFGSMVALLMRSADEKSLSLTDLEWLVLPALARGQFAVAEAQPKDSGAIMPVGLVLWALVSPDVDARLAGHGEGVLRLAPADWQSGNIPWIIVRAGEPKVVGRLLEQLVRTVFKGRPPRMRVRDGEGKFRAGRVEIKAASTSAA